MILCAGNNETFSFATPIGVGLVQSAINTTRIALLDKPDFLLFVGSAGSYDIKKHKILDIVTSSSASQIEKSFFKDESYTPIDNAISNELDFIQNTTMVNSSNYINTCDESFEDFTKNNITIENMEFFSILSIAKEFDIPTAGIFVITNYTNKNAHLDFEKNHQKAKKVLIDYLKEKKLIK